MRVALALLTGAFLILAGVTVWVEFQRRQCVSDLDVVSQVAPIAVRLAEVEAAATDACLSVLAQAHDQAQRFVLPVVSEEKED